MHGQIKSLSTVIRCMEACNVLTIEELSICLETTPEKLCELIDKNINFPDEWVLLLIMKYDINPLWLITGKGEKIITELGGSLRSLFTDDPEYIWEYRKKKYAPKVRNPEDTWVIYDENKK